MSAVSLPGMSALRLATLRSPGPPLHSTQYSDAGWQLPAVLSSPSLAREPRPRGWRGRPQLLPTPRGPAPPPPRGGGQQSPPLPRSPPLRPARRPDPLQVPGSAALPACSPGPRAPTPPPAQRSDVVQVRGPFERDKRWL